MYRLLNQELTLLMFDYFTQSCKEAKTAKSVMLSDSETSHHSWRSQTGDPSLTLPVYASLRDRQDDATKMCGAGKAERAERSGMPRFFFGYFLCSNDKESNDKNLGHKRRLDKKKESLQLIKIIFYQTIMRFIFTNKPILWIKQH